MELKDKDLTDRIIAAAIQVHRHLGPGYLESIYEEALAVEFNLQGISFHQQKTVPIQYKGRDVGEHRLDFLVGDRVVLELKAIKTLDPIHFSIVRSYMKATGRTTGLLLNFASMPLTIKRVGGERKSPSNDS